VLRQDAPRSRTPFSRRPRLFPLPDSLYKVERPAGNRLARPRLGETVYHDDLKFHDELFAAYVCSTKLAPVVAIDPSPALGMEGVHKDGFIGATVRSCPARNMIHSSFMLRHSSAWA
jgi:hypothetical protein